MTTKDTAIFTRTVKVIDKEELPEDAIYMETAHDYNKGVTYNYYAWDTYYGVEYLAVDADGDMGD